MSSRDQGENLSYDECMSLMNAARFSEAVPSLLVLKKHYEQNDEYEGAIYFDIILALHYYYMGIGDYASSRDLLIEAGNTFNKMEPEPNNEFIRNLLCCRGQLEVMLKNYGEALGYLNQAQAYFEEKNDYSDSYFVTMMNMALSYLNNGDLLSAKLYMDEAIDLFENNHGNIYDIKEETQFIILSNYGYLNLAIGHDKEAEDCFVSVINNCKKTAFSYDAYMLACNNLSTLYMKQGRWADGVKLLEGISSENNDYNYVFSQNKTICYYFLRDIPSSLAALQEMNKFSILNIEKLFSHFSRLESENYWTEISREYVFLNNLIAYHTNDEQAIGIAYNNGIFCNNLLINSVRLLDSFISQSSDLAIKQQYEKYNNLKNELAYKTANQSNRDSLAREIMDTERTILKSTDSIGQWLVNNTKSWENIRDLLDDNEIAIEFCYAPRMEKYPDIQPYFGAFLLRKDFDSPKLISLENVDVVEEVFYNDDPDEIFINELYTTDKTILLYNMLWEKLSPYLKDVKTVYYSPTGSLSKVNFDILHGKDGIMLGERYSMYRISSTANIGELKEKNSKTYHSSVLYGNIKYDESAEEMENASASYSSFSGLDIESELALRSENERGRWGPIPATKVEIENIGKLFIDKGIRVSTFEDSKGNEESFKSFSSNSPEIIHLATHGFVIDTQQRAEGNKFVNSTNIYSKNDSYMMWAGLMLAGGNNKWRGNFNLRGIEDGVLTADEISRLDLSNTKLVVLSACETARGRIDPIDGVYGLQRAFKMAGAGTIVMSLWKVQDDATSMLMTQFYTYLLNGIEKHQALWKAMMDVRDKYHDPYYWAGFVMLD